MIQAGVGIEVIAAQIDEGARPGETPRSLALRLAREKAHDVARRLEPEPVRRVLAADTIVVVDDDVLGKPEDPEHAVRLLLRLVGRQHRVITGIALARTSGGDIRTAAVESRVTMRAADEAEVRDYVATGEPMDKAGAYALQGEAGRRFVVALEGSRSNVIGLPLEETLALLALDGWSPSPPGDRAR